VTFSIKPCLPLLIFFTVDAHHTKIGQAFSLTLTIDFSNLWRHRYRFTHGSFHTNYAALPLSSVSVSRQITYYRNLNWTFEDLLQCYCYAINTNSRTIRSQVSQPCLCRQSNGHAEWIANSSLVSLHNTKTVNLTLVQCQCHTGK